MPDESAHERSEGWRAERRRLVELVGASAIVVAQPLLAVFGSSPETFVSVGADRTAAIVFACAVVVVPPMLVWAIGWFVSRRRSYRTSIHRVSMALLLGLGAAQALVEWTSARGAALAAVAAAVVVAAHLLLARFARGGEVLRWCAVVAPVSLVMFAVASPTADALAAASTGDREAWLAASPVASQEGPPIVVVVFDALGTWALLDGSGHVDAELFPNFASLERRGVFYRRHTTVSTATTRAVPALLTGRTDAGAPGAAASLYEQNLFTLLGRGRSLRAVEAVTALCPRAFCAGPRPRAGAAARLAGEAVEVGMRRVGLRALVEEHETLLRSDPEPAGEAMARFLPLLDSSTDQLAVLHVMSPHGPFLVDERGVRYPGPPAAGNAAPVADEEAAAQTRQRYLLHVADADRLLGQLLDRLDALGIADDTMLVVTGDHGASFDVGEYDRSLGPDSTHQVAWTPLFVRMPGQTVTGVSDAPTSIVDVLPTIAAASGVRVPWRVDGESLLDGVAERPIEVFVPDERRGGRLGADWVSVDGGWRVAVDRRAGEAKLLASGPHGASGPAALRLHGRGPAERWLGASTSELPPTPGGVTLRVDEPQRFAAVPPHAEQLPLWVEGTAVVRGTTASWGVVAIVDGVVVATAPLVARGGDSADFALFVPSAVVTTGAHRLEVRALPGPGTTDP